MRQKELLVTAALWAVSLLMAIMPVVQARIITVAPAGGDYTRIQAALDASAPGDTLLVQNGSYNEKITIPRSGDAVNGYITLQAATGARPVISGLGLSGSNLITLNTRSYIRVVGFELRDNLGVSDGSAIRITGSGTNIEILNNRIHEIRGTNAMGITVYGTSASAPIANLIIDGNEIYDCDPAQSEALTLNGNVDGFQVTGNYVHDVNNIGIDFIGGEQGFPAPPLVARNGVCRRNRVFRARSNYGGGYGAGIYVDGGKELIIEQNIVSESDLGIEIGAENSGLVTSGVIVRNNLLYLNDKAGLVFGGYESAAGRVQNCQFLNNVCYKNDTKNDGNGQLWIQFAGGNSIRSNIFWAAANGVQIASDSGNTGNTLDYNLWYADPGTPMEFTWNAKSYSGFSAYRSGTNQDAHSLSGDPLFVNPTAADFHVRTGSPAIDSGDPDYQPAPGIQDLDGNARLFGSRVDIGAYEYNSGAATSSTTTTAATSTSSTVPTTTSSTTSTSTTVPTTTSSTTSTSSTVSATTTTTTLLPGRGYLRVFPKIQFEPQKIPVAPNAGIALANLSGIPAQLRWQAFADNGTLVGEAQTSLAPGRSLAAIARELLPSVGSTATWMLLESSSPDLLGFFLLFDDLVSVMDGSTVSGNVVQNFDLPVAEEAEVTMVNPGTQPVNYRLAYISSDGLLSRSLQGMIPPKGRVAFPADILRPAGSPGGYLQGLTGGVVPLEVFGNPAWMAALGPVASWNSSVTVSGPPPGLTLCAPQFVFGGGYSTAVDLVNLESTALQLTARMVNDNGQLLGAQANLLLPAAGSLRVDNPLVFGLSPGAAALQGYLLLQSASGRFAGSVLFTDAQRLRFGCALPLSETAQSLLHFSHLAQDTLYYTGLAVVNTNAQPDDVRITVYNSQGSLLATGTRQIPAGGRLIGVLPELVGPFPALSKGYFQVQSQLPVFGFALFGTHNGETLAAIPAQTPIGN